MAMFSNLDINYLFHLTNKLLKIIILLFFLFLSFGLIQSLWISPIDYIQGHSVRIMYVHVPSSWISLFCFATIGFLSIFNFVFKSKNFQIICKSLAPIGLTFTVISIVTGSLWGQPTWGTWWAWDVRLTSMLILCLFYILYIFSLKFIKNFDYANKVSSILAIVGLINIPIIKFSVDWWSTLHQPATIKLTSESTIHYSMLLPLIMMLFALLLYSALIFIMKYKTEIIKIKNKGLDRI